MINFMSIKLGPHAEMVEATQSDQNHNFYVGSLMFLSFQNIYINTAYIKIQLFRQCCRRWPALGRHIASASRLQ